MRERRLWAWEDGARACDEHESAEYLTMSRRERTRIDMILMMMEPHGTTERAVEVCLRSAARKFAALGEEVENRWIT